MIDKVEMVFQDFKVGDKPKLLLRPAKVDMETGTNRDEFFLWRSSAGEEVFGAGAFRNTDIANIDIDGRGMRVIFNPAIVCNGNNFYRLKDRGQLGEAIQRVDGVIKDTGIHCDISSGRLSRLDLAKDSEMEEPFDTYRQLFRFLEAKRAKSKDIEESYYFSNKRRQAIFYDKVHEMAQRDEDTTKEMGLSGKNIMRCELRFRGSKPVADNTGIPDIRTLNTAEAFDSLRPTYNKVIADFVFRQCDGGGQLRFNFMRELDILKFFKDTYRRNSLQRYKAYNGITGIVEKCGSLQNYKRLLLSAGYDRTYVFREAREIQRQLAAMGQIEERHSGRRTIQSLYDEVYSKVMAA